jgi:site-specific recombinase XerD
MIEGKNKTDDSRIRQFCEWLDSAGQEWYSPDLAAYRDELLRRVKASSVEQYLSTIRGAYKKLLRSNGVRDFLTALAGVTVKPLDCRRTYARLLFEAGVDLVAIQQNLGHNSLVTTLHYVGLLDASKRCAPNLYDFEGLA